MEETPTSRSDLTIFAIRERIGIAPGLYVGPEGDYLRLKQIAPSIVDMSISWVELPDDCYSVQVCLDGDPLSIAYDDECSLRTLADLCQQFFNPANFLPATH